MLIRCVGCGKKLKLRDELAGKAVKCPACQRVMRVPGKGTSEPSIEEEAPPQPQPLPLPPPPEPEPEVQSQPQPEPESEPEPWRHAFERELERELEPEPSIEPPPPSDPEPELEPKLPPLPMPPEFEPEPESPMPPLPSSEPELELDKVPKESFETETKPALPGGIRAFVLGLLVLTCGWIGIFALVSGLRANARRKAAGQPKSGLATAGWILGILGIPWGLAQIALLAVFVLPMLLLAIRAANEQAAASSLRQVQSVEMTFRSSDLDRNGYNDYWVGDLSGLRLFVPEGADRPIVLIDAQLADADGRSLAGNPPAGIRYDRGYNGPKAREGYLFAAIARYTEPEGEVRPYHEGSCTNYDRYGFSAYPEKYPETGNVTLIITEQGTLWKKELQGLAMEELPRTLK